MPHIVQYLIFILALYFDFAEHLSVYYLMHILFLYNCFLKYYWKQCITHCYIHNYNFWFHTFNLYIIKATNWLGHILLTVTYDFEMLHSNILFPLHIIGHYIWYIFCPNWHSYSCSWLPLCFCVLLHFCTSPNKGVTYSTLCIRGI